MERFSEGLPQGKGFSLTSSGQDFTMIMQGSQIGCLFGCLHASFSSPNSHIIGSSRDFGYDYPRACWDIV